MMTLSVKKELVEILKEKFPGKRFGVDRNEQDQIEIYYDAYLSEDEVEQMKDLLAKHKIEARLERMVF